MIYGSMQNDANGRKKRYKKVKNLRLYEKHKKGRTYYQLRTPDPSGTGYLEQQFSDQGEAKTAFEIAYAAHENHGLAAHSFDAKGRGDALAALDILTPFGISLVDAAEYYADHHQSIQESKLVKDAVEELIKAKKQDGLSHRYTKDLRNRLDSFVLKFGERKIAELTGEQIETWLRELCVGPLTRNTFRMRLSVLFGFAQRRRWFLKNPLQEVEKAKWKGAEPGTLTPDQFAKLLEVASTETLPYWAIGGFCGLRSAELERLEWQDIDIDRGLVEVTRGKSKTAARRHVAIRPALAAWLESYRGRTEGRVCPPNLRKLLEADRARAGIVKWPTNGLRHSFASYHLEHFKQPGTLTVEMGHVDEDLVSRFYRRRVRPEAAAQWWSITPQKTDKIVKMETAA